MNRRSWLLAVAVAVTVGTVLWIGCRTARLPLASRDAKVPTGREVAADAEAASREARADDTGPALYESNFERRASDTSTFDTGVDTRPAPDEDVEDPSERSDVGVRADGRTADTGGDADIGP